MRWCLTLLLVSLNLASIAQNRMNSSEVGYVYDLENEFLIDHRVASMNDRHKVFIKFTLNSGNVKISDYQISYDLRTSYTSEKATNAEIRLDSTKIIYTGFREFIYAFELADVQEKTLLVVDIYNFPKNRRFKYDIPLQIGEKRFPSFLFFEPETDIPFFQTYLNAGEKLRIKNVFTESGNFEITGVQNNAGFPMPPFDETEQDDYEKTTLDTLYGTQHNEVFTFHNEGYYTINSSEARTLTRYLLVEDAFYPYYGDYKDLAKPLIFLSTNDEYQALQEAKDSRDGFETFVQNVISSNQRVAQDFIKYYYRRIRKVGRLFTSDRAGWKTDRGMVYLVFGDPIQVFRNEKTELWVYATGDGGRLRFVFDIIEENGEIRHQLIRGKRYREDWMTAVTQWRAGRIIE